MFFTAATTSGQRGGLFGMNGMASFENMGSWRALLTLPPTQIERPSFSASASVIAGHTVKQLPQNMHCSSMISTVCFPSTIFGRMAPVGHEDTVVGISQIFGSSALLIFGRVLWTARMAMSEQCTAPHMLRQQAKAMRNFPGRSIFSKRGKRSSITAFTTPEASLAAEWQCTQPCAWTMLVIDGPLPPTGEPSFLSRSMRGSIFFSSVKRNSMLLRLGGGGGPPPDKSAHLGQRRVGFGL